MKTRKKTNSFALALRLRARAATLLIALLCGVTGAWAQETLTVYDETSSNSELIPMSGYYFDYYTKSECIIPASELTAMEGGTITAITFYVKEIASSQKGNWNGTNQKVFLKEVSGTTLSSFSGMTGATVVFNGSLPIPTTVGGYTINFSQGYTYNGGNLLIGVYNETKGNYNRVKWYGKGGLSDRVSGHGHSSDESIGLEAQYFLPKTTFTYTPAPTAVDLGLPSGTKWADMNVGAGSETGYGTYFAWAATASQADYSQANAPYYSGSAYTKYTGSDYTMLQRGDDAATVNWGSNWRMPTDTELQELIDNTTKEWKTNYNETGVNGYLLTSKTNGNSIFLPAAGWYNGTELRSASQGGNYWMSTVVTSDVSCGYSLNFYSTGYAPYKDDTDTRYVGFSIRPVQMFAGEGTEASPYLIASTTDWDNLSAAVNAGTEYSGIYFKLTANISVTTMIGASDKPFRGSFDGGGHTLTVNYTASAAGTAPFPRTASTTLIKNLRVAGTITGGGFKVAGLVSEPVGATIEHCRVSATISANTYHGLWIGGFCNGGNVTINNCLFDGKINCVGGGFIGYSETTSRITNCLFAPQTGSSLGSSQDGNGVFIYTKGRESNLGTITNCYYTSLAGGVEQDGATDGSTMSAAEHVNALGPSNWKVVDGNAIPKVHPGLSGLGTQASPYLIASTTDWNNLVSAVNAGETYSGNNFKMTANVGTVSTWMTGDLTTTGIFSGHFDGDGHTLTVNYSSDTQYCHPFGFLRGATIENLHVTGNITTSQTYAAGLASRALSYSTNYITNCLVSTNITSTRSGTANICGVVMSVQASATLYIEGCAFTGSITSSNGTDNGGFSEWVTAGGTFSATNCLFAPSSVTDKSLENSATFCRNGGSYTNCYYTRTLGTAQGLQARTIDAGDYVSTLSVTKGSATATYAVSGITVYSGGIDFNDGSTTTFYGGSGQTVSLDLTPETRTGYQFKQYAASQGTLSGQTTNTPTLTMPAANSTANDVVTISAEYDPTYNADFADGNDNTDWDIDPMQQIAGGTVTVSYTGENKVKSVTVKANPSTLAGLKAAINDASDLTDLNTKVLGKYVTATGNIQSTSEGAVGIIAYISKTAVDNSFADSRIFVIATENASNSATQAPTNAAETTYNSTSDLNGYAVTNAWQALDGYNASKAGWNYSASRPDGASHRFVPSYGQWMLGGWNDGNNRPCRLMRSTMEGSGQFYAVSTAINTEGNDTGYCVDGSWWGMGSIQRIQGILVRAAFVY